MKTIITFIDFSELTSKLIEQTQLFAKAFRAQVVLVHVEPMEPLLMEIDTVSARNFDAGRQRAIEANLQKLSSLAESLRLEGAAARVEQLVDADPDTTMAKCEKLAPDMIIVGCHHHSVFYKMFIGAFSSEVLKRTHCPVLVVPAPVQEPAPERETEPAVAADPAPMAML